MNTIHWYKKTDTNTIPNTNDNDDENVSKIDVDDVNDNDDDCVDKSNNDNNDNNDRYCKILVFGLVHRLLIGYSHPEQCM